MSSSVEEVFKAFTSKPLPGAVVNDLTDKELVLDIVSKDKDEVIVHHVRLDLSSFKKVKGSKRSNKYWRNHGLQLRMDYNG